MRTSLGTCSPPARTERIASRAVTRPYVESSPRKGRNLSLCGANDRSAPLRGCGSIGNCSLVAFTVALGTNSLACIK